MLGYYHSSCHSHWCKSVNTQPISWVSVTVNGCCLYVEEMRVILPPLQEIIADLVVSHHQQTIWNMLAISKSSYKIRQDICCQIFEKAKAKSPNISLFLRDISKLSGINQSSRWAESGYAKVQLHWPTGDCDGISHNGYVNGFTGSYSRVKNSINEDIKK